MTYEILTPSILAPISLDDAKLHMRVDSNDENAVIENLIKSAVEAFETATSYAILTQTWMLTFDVWPAADQTDGWWDGVKVGAIGNLTSGHVDIDKAPFVSVEKVETINDDGNFDTWDSANYYFIKNMKFGQLFADEVNFPTPARDRAGIKITFKVGHATEAQVPYLIKNALLQLVEHWYEKKSEDTPLPKAYLSAVASFRNVRI